MTTFAYDKGDRQRTMDKGWCAKSIDPEMISIGQVLVELLSFEVAGKLGL